MKNHLSLPDPVDFVTCSMSMAGEPNRFRIFPALDKPYYRIEGKHGRFLDEYHFYANASSLSSAFEMISQEHWERTRVSAIPRKV